MQEAGVACWEEVTRGQREVANKPVGQLSWGRFSGHHTGMSAELQASRPVESHWLPLEGIQCLCFNSSDHIHPPFQPP